jgi:hypothetical protein
LNAQLDIQVRYFGPPPFETWEEEEKMGEGIKDEDEDEDEEDKWEEIEAGEEGWEDARARWRLWGINALI